jgi:glycyl-tRNA synthetase
MLKDGKLMAPLYHRRQCQQSGHPDVVRAGNEGVIRARYADAAYFYRADTGRPLESFTPRLATLTFHEKLGSMLDKVRAAQGTCAADRRNAGSHRRGGRTIARAAELSKV